MATEPSGGAAAATKAEVERRQHTVDMMLSMHSALRDRYARWAAALDLVIFAGSTVITATLLLDPRVLSYLRLSEDWARLVLAGVSTLMFFLSILTLRVDWKEKAARHQRSSSLLADLKARGRFLIDECNAGAVAEYFRLYDFTMAANEPIPEREFLPLKARHRRKIALSKALDRHASCPVWLLRLRLLLTDSKSAWTQTNAEAQPNASKTT